MVQISAEDFMCYECDIRNSDCTATNGRDISKTACTTEKCLISGTILLLNKFLLKHNVMPTSIHSVPMQ